jgi:hypothetical protein
VCDVSFNYQGSHPAAPGHRVCWEIENDREIMPQNVDNVRTHRSPKSRR